VIVGLDAALIILGGTLLLVMLVVITAFALCLRDLGPVEPELHHAEEWNWAAEVTMQEGEYPTKPQPAALPAVPCLQEDWVQQVMAAIEEKPA
jgi:hypothetical protein